MGLFSDSFWKVLSLSAAHALAVTSYFFINQKISFIMLYNMLFWSESTVVSEGGCLHTHGVEFILSFIYTALASISQYHMTKLKLTGTCILFKNFQINVIWNFFIAFLRAPSQQTCAHVLQLETDGTFCAQNVHLQSWALISVLSSPQDGRLSGSSSL